MSVAVCSLSELPEGGGEAKAEGDRDRRDRDTEDRQTLHNSGNSIHGCVLLVPCKKYAYACTVAYNGQVAVFLQSTRKNGHVYLVW